MADLRAAVARGEIEVLEARSGGGVLAGAAVLVFRPSISLGGAFASVEELQVRAGGRRRGVGRALLALIEERCVRRGVLYVEVQTDAEARPFYERCGFAGEPEALVMARSLPAAVQPRN